MKNLTAISFVLLLIGGINWGLIGLFEFDLISSIFGEMTVLTRAIDVLFGLSAAYRIALWLKARSKR